MRYKWKENIREYIMEMSNLATRLKALKLELSEDILVHLVLISLPTQFSPFKISYNTQKEKWTRDELIAQCVQEEERLKQEKLENAHLASTSQGFGPQTLPTLLKAIAGRKDVYPNLIVHSPKRPQRTQGELMDATNPPICQQRKGCLKSQRPTDGERYIYVGNDNKAVVKAIGLFRCLGHISNQHIQRLVLEGILDPLDFSDFQNFKAEVENQLNKKIKVVRSDREGEYYGRYDESGEQRPRSFAKYLMECGIVPQYTMPRTPSQKWVYILNRVSSKAIAKTPYELWTSKKPSIRHLHAWGCPVDVRPYKPNEKKLDSRTVSYYFVGYSERSRGFKLYDPSTRSLFETDNAKFIEDVELSEREPLRKVVFEEEYVSIPIITTEHGHIMFDDTIHNVQPITEIVDTPEIPPAQVIEPIQVHKEVTQQPQEPQVQVPLRKSTRKMKSAISNDYVVYLQKHEFDMGLEDDPISVSQVKQSFDSEKWIEAMKDEMKSIKDNGVWDLVELPECVKPIDYKWILKIKRDSKGNIARYKARLVAKGFTQKEDIDYKETFSPVSSNDSFRIIMALVAHYGLELHQMDIKTAFLKVNIDETIYMVQPENFESNDSKQLVCKLKRSMYGLKKASQQWYRKFDQAITSFGFKENIVDQCIYLKFSGSKFIILVLYVDDILFASSDVELLHETKRFLSSKFDMKDLVGSLMYAQVCTHPDIAYIVGMLGKYLSNPSMDHWKKAKRVMRCLQRTKDYMLTYRRSSHLEIVGYSDSDFAGCLDSRRSTLGYIFMLARGVVSWKSVKQTLIASSTMEA
ncbi:Retrovirus-related Pol polyprotein from transposon TNT 1-94 [Vitis vinifera]|uniref:Retrovirus-related Pol polyprotein from transposon TNT 1-94 n=1 Tax=Vitis vinifera TaxID=29760 RepID=A0A438KI68_VITVI|nr:Retrovirus-related Pol polyprotein from transposon TNT 1-94 [Vitis vinifera]